MDAMNLTEFHFAGPFRILFHFSEVHLDVSEAADGAKSLIFKLFIWNYYEKGRGRGR